MQGLFSLNVSKYSFSEFQGSSNSTGYRADQAGTQIRDEGVLLIVANRRGTDAAVADDVHRNAVIQMAVCLRVVYKGKIRMGMHIDEPRCDDASCRINTCLLSYLQIANSGNLISDDANIPCIGIFPCTVDDEAVYNLQVEHRPISLLSVLGI